MVCLVVGAFILAGLRVAAIDFGSPWIAAYIVGIGCVLAGPLLLLRGHLRLLDKERVLTISEDGLRWQVGDTAPSFVAWSALGEVAIVDDALVIAPARGAGAEPWRLPLPFEGIASEDLVRLLGELQQKALLGLPVRPRQLAADRSRSRS